MKETPHQGTSIKKVQNSEIKRKVVPYAKWESEWQYWMLEDKEVKSSKFCRKMILIKFYA